MADYSSSFVNPSYATPEQLRAQRAYADELTKRAGQDANRPTGALANMVNALTGVLERNRATEIQSQAAGQNAGDVSALISQLQKGQAIDPNTAGRVYANPMASPEHRALIGALVTPKVGEDVAGRPAVTSPAGGMQALPVGPGVEPGIRTGLSTPDASISVAPQAAPSLPGAPRSMVPPTPPGVTRLDPAATNAWRQSNPLPPGVAPAGPQAGAGTPPAPPAAVPNMPMNIDQLAAKGRELAAARELTQGGAKANSDVIGADIASANDAPNILKGVGVIKDNIQRYGDNITFGPTSPWSLEMKRAAANYAPGFMKDQLNAVAAADSINKVGIGLAGTLAGQLQGGANADTFAKAMQGVPGLTTSKQGALAMADMIQQAALKSQELGTLLRDPANFSRYAELKANFFRDHPVINPLTGNPIEMDVEAVRKNGDGTGSAPSGFKVLKVH